MSGTRVWVLRIFGIVSLLLIVGWATEYAQQWVLRWRAERLLADVKQLQVGRGSWEDAQRLMRKWGRWGESDGTGPCTAQNCYYRVVIRHIVPLAPEYDKNGKPVAHLARITDYLGLRNSAVIGGFQLSGGVVIEKFFGMDVNLPVRAWINPEGALIPDLVVSSASGATLRYEPDKRYLALHPNRRYFYFKMPDYMLGVKFTPQEPPAEQAALMDFRLSCLTQWVACQTRGDILPGAFEEFEGELHALIREGPERERPTNCPLGAVSRDAPNVFAGEVMRPDPALKQRGSWPVIFRVEEVLKGHAPVPVGTEMRLGLPLAMVDSMQKELPSRIILAGDVAWQFYTADDHRGGIFIPGDCGAFEASKENLQSARQGSAEDIGSRAK